MKPMKYPKQHCGVNCCSKMSVECREKMSGTNRNVKGNEEWESMSDGEWELLNRVYDRGDTSGGTGGGRSF